MPIDPTQLAALSAILRLGSFEAAAASLNVTPSAISQRLKALEERIGATLVTRSQPCTATPLGTRLAKHAEDVALLEAAALGDIAKEAALPARLTLAVPADCMDTWLVPALAAAPAMLFDLRIDDQDTADEWLRRGAVSAAVTGKNKAVTGCDLHPLGALRYSAVASPDYMARYFPAGITAECLASAPMLTFTSKDQLQARWITAKTGRSLYPPTHQMPSTPAFDKAALTGMAWGMIPESLIRDHLASGRLVTLDATLPMDVPLYWQVTRAMAPALAPLTREILRIGLKQLRPLQR
ncbi:LysR family transcriptional regulator ArgP [Sulfitobacter sp. F26204]|uniref:LysR family transcriptional regulator ArgP n=1 Tax=Sulfitobacter sp. F26204 TaxID=2996014 RepID=UPI00225E0A21|nr:LysR family transcriptional regulator ArgP [Sulfitobacter sp. F26204]MCX7559100.1 LysR family transcriptional regulator ArgP [Sulfitobacter sp. F26204]